MSPRFMPINTIFESEGMFLKHNPYSNAYIFNFGGSVYVYGESNIPKSFEELTNSHFDIKRKILDKTISEDSVKSMFKKLYKPRSS